MSGANQHLSYEAVRVPPKIAPPAKRDAPALLALGTFAVIAAGLVLFWFDPAQYRLYPFCFFHEFTGLNCPGCGGTRALHQLLHGNVTAALHLNALVVVSLPLLAWLGVRFTVGQFHRRPAGRFFSPNWLWLFLALAVVFSVLRNLPAFAWLAP